MAVQPPQLFGVTFVPPAVGAAPVPQACLGRALACLEVIHGAPRTLGDSVRTGFGMVARHILAALVARSYRPQAHGLSSTESEMLARQAASVLDGPGRGHLLDYMTTCANWERRLRNAIGSDRADPDWHMTSARNVSPSAPEALLAQSLEGVGIPVQSQVGVAQDRGGRRRGGWYGSYWLDCAHRDPAYLLRVNIELDGARHYNQERWAKDRHRNDVLADRGWYVVRISGRILGQEHHRAALAELVALVERHRRAVILARSDRRAVHRVFEVS